MRVGQPTWRSSHDGCSRPEHCVWPHRGARFAHLLGRVAWYWQAGDFLVRTDRTTKSKMYFSGSMLRRIDLPLQVL
jgi:hypothetical protein